MFISFVEFAKKYVNSQVIAEALTDTVERFNLVALLPPFKESS